MKKWIAIIVFSVLCTAVISIHKVDLTSNTQVIYIKGGEPVLAESITKPMENRHVYER